MKDKFNNFDPNAANQQQPQNMRPLFAPKPDVPRGRNLIGDNPFHNYLPYNPNQPVQRQPVKPQPAFPHATIPPNNLPFYAGSAQQYRNTANVLWENKLKNLNTTNPEHMKFAENALNDFFGKHHVKILTNPNEPYQTKQYIDEQLKYLLNNDGRYSPYYNMLTLQQKKIQQDQDEFNRLKAEEAELTKKFNDYGAFQRELHDDVTNLVKKESDNNLLLEPELADFPRLADFFANSGLVDSEYDKMFNTRKEGFWDRLFGSGKGEPDDIEKIYKAMRLFSKKPQSFGKFLEDIEGPYSEWAKKHYTKGVEEGGNTFDTDLKFAVHKLYKDLLGKNRETDEKKESETLQRKLDQWQDDEIKKIIKNNGAEEAGDDLADQLIDLMKNQKKLPNSLSEQPKDIDLKNFITGNKVLNNYLYQFLKNHPYGNWREQLKKDLNKTFTSYYNQNLSFGNTLDKLTKIMEDLVHKAGGVEKFLIDNIKHENEGIIPVKQTPEDALNALRKKNEYLKKYSKGTADIEMVNEIIKDLSPEIAKELTKQAVVPTTSKKKPLEINIQDDSEDESISIGTPDSDDTGAYPYTQPATPKKKGSILNFDEIKDFIKRAQKDEIPIDKVSDTLIEVFEGLKQFAQSSYNAIPMEEIQETTNNAINNIKTYAQDAYAGHQKRRKALRTEQQELAEIKQIRTQENLRQLQQTLDNAITSIKDAYENLPTEKMKESAGNILNDAQGQLKNTYNTVKEVTNDALDTLNTFIEKQYSNLQDNTIPALQTYLTRTIDEISENLSPQTKEEIFNNFGHQNSYIEESLKFDIDAAANEAAEVLTDELAQQNLAFNPETIKPKIIENITPFIIDEVIIKNESIVEKAKQDIEQKQLELAEIIAQQVSREPVKVNIQGENEDEFITFGTPDYMEPQPLQRKIREISKPQKSKEDLNKALIVLEDITNTLGQVDFITQKMIEQEAIKQKTTPEEVINKVQEAIINKPVEELKPLEKIYYNDTLLNEQAEKLGENFVDKDNEALKLNGNKEADLIIDTAKQVYDDTLIDKVMDYIDNPNNLLSEKYKQYQEDIIDLIYDFYAFNYLKELNRDYKKLKNEGINRDIDIFEEYDFSGDRIVQYIKNKLIHQSIERIIQKESDKAQKDNNIEEGLILDYYNNHLITNIKNLEKFLSKEPEIFQKIKEIYNTVKPLMEKQISDDEIKPALTSYINSAAVNSNDLKSSIKELGNAITGLTEEQLRTAIQNLPEEDRNKLINKVNNDLNTLLDAVKEYAPAVMESFDIVKEAQAIDTLVQNYQISPEVLQTVENKIREITGEKGLTQQTAEKQLIETTKGRGFGEIEEKINKLVPRIEGVNFDANRNIDQHALGEVVRSVLNFAEGGKHPSQRAFPLPTGPNKDAVFDLFEIEHLLRILYPIFKNMGLELSDYDIADPKQYRAFGPEVVIPNTGYSEKGWRFAIRYKNYILPKFEELKNAVKNLPNFPAWLDKSTFEPNLEKAIKTAKEHHVTDPSIDAFMEKYKEYQNAIHLIRQRLEELFKIHAAFTTAESEKEDDTMWGGVLGAVLGAVATIATPWGAAILTPSILAGTAAGTATSVTLGALAGASLGSSVQGMFGAKEYSNSGEVKNDIGELERTMREYYQKSNEAQTEIRKKIIEIGTKKE